MVDVDSRDGSYVTIGQGCETDSAWTWKLNDHIIRRYTDGDLVIYNHQNESSVLLDVDAVEVLVEHIKNDHPELTGSKNVLLTETKFSEERLRYQNGNILLTNNSSEVLLTHEEVDEIVETMQRAGDFEIEWE